VTRGKSDLNAALAERLLLPLLVGGKVQLLPPFGAKRAFELAMQGLPVASDVAERIAQARLRVLRRIVPIDVLGEPEPDEWLLLFALNDLLQATNPDLIGLTGADRPRKLLEMASQVIERAGAPRTLGDALARHATFSRVQELSREDQHVEWWVGQGTFRGVRAPKRLLLWPRLRKVASRIQILPLHQMPPPETPWSDRWSATLARFVAASPLSDLATIARAAPAFEFTGANLGLLSTHAGFELGARVVERSQHLGRAVESARAAAHRLRDGSQGAQRTARLFIERLDQRRALAV
jgi:hypothetical protein